ncbi:MAG: hypothetical protein ABIL05_03550 [candidate division WOR-3 bacterium]
MKKKHLFINIAKISLILILALIVIIPLKVPYQITTTGEVRPLRIWALTRGEGGQIQARSFNFKKGTAEGFSVIQLQRGEDMRFILNPLLAEKKEIAEGDTIGTIYSSEFERDLTRVKGSLEVAREELRLAQERSPGGQTKLIQAKIDALEKELAVLLKRKQSFSILAPFPSVIVRLATPAETLLLLHDVRTRVVLMPIPDEYLPDPEEIQSVELSVGQSRITIDRSNFFISPNRVHIAGREVVIGRALITEQAFTIPSGMLIRCSIHCQPVILRVYLRRFFERMIT